MNVPGNIARLVTSDMRVPMIDLQTVYGAEDLYNMLEMLAVDRHNQALLMKAD